MVKLDILLVGGATQDIFLKAKSFIGNSLPMGEKLEAKEMIIATGGGASNVSVGLQRLGVKTGVLVLVGNDEAGKKIIDEFKEEEVKNLLDLREGLVTAQSFIFVSGAGERIIIEYRGGSNSLDLESEKILLGDIETKWLYVIDNLGEKSTANFKFLINWAKQKNISIVFTPNRKMIEERNEWLNLLKDVDVLIVNAEEGAKILDSGLEKQEMEIVKMLLEMVKGIAVVTAGKKGSWCAQKNNPEKIYFVPSPKDEIVDRTGAGDAYSSGFLAQYLKNRDIEEAMNLGTQNATSVVRYFGGKKGLLKHN